MPEVRRRRVAEKVTRPRDRARAEEVDEDEEDEEEPPPRRARKATKATKKATTRRRRPDPEEDEEDEDDYEEDEDAEEEEEDEEPPPPRRKKAAATKKAAPKRTTRRRPVEDDEDEEEEEPAPSRRSRTAAKKASGVTKKRKGGLPPGLHTGLAGAEAVTKSGGGGVVRLTPTKEPELFKALEDAPFVSFRQHWIPQGGGQGDRPFTCLEKDCPLCDSGDRSGKVFVFNILHLSTDDGEPTNKILQLGVKAYESFKAAATPRGKDKPLFNKDYWTITRSGKGNKSQTNFTPLKERDLEEDWEEIFELFTIEELPDIIAEAEEDLFDYSIIEVKTAKQLRDIARHLSEDDDEDEDEDDD
jgi:hypothetical protein